MKKISVLLLALLFSASSWHQTMQAGSDINNKQMLKLAGGILAIGAISMLLQDKTVQKSFTTIGLSKEEMNILLGIEAPLICLSLLGNQAAAYLAKWTIPAFLLAKGINSYYMQHLINSIYILGSHFVSDEQIARYERNQISDKEKAANIGLMLAGIALFNFLQRALVEYAPNKLKQLSMYPS